MEPRANHVLIGAFTLAGLALLVVVGLWSARWGSDQAWQHFEVHFLQPVSGLSVGSAVHYNGISMGSVRDLYLAPDDPGRVIALIRVEADVPVREDTTARLAVSGLTGVSTIQLRGGSPDSPPLRPAAGEELAQIIAEESALQKLIETSEDIASTASKVMLRLIDFLSEENAERVSTTLDNIDAFTLALSSESERIGEIVRNVHQGSEQLGPVMADLRTVVRDISDGLERLETSLSEDFPEAGEELSRTLSKLASAADRIERMVAANESAIGGFGDDVLTPLGPAVDEFRRLIMELSSLTARFERHPARFLIGGEQPEEYEPE